MRPLDQVEDARAFFHCSTTTETPPRRTCLGRKDTFDGNANRELDDLGIGGRTDVAVALDCHQEDRLTCSSRGDLDKAAIYDMSEATYYRHINLYNSDQPSSIARTSIKMPGR